MLEGNSYVIEITYEWFLCLCSYRGLGLDMKMDLFNILKAFFFFLQLAFFNNKMSCFAGKIH